MDRDLTSLREPRRHQIPQHRLDVSAGLIDPDSGFPIELYRGFDELPESMTALRPVRR
jgi:hypothetical protein